MKADDVVWRDMAPGGKDGAGAAIGDREREREREINPRNRGGEAPWAPGGFRHGEREAPIG